MRIDKALWFLRFVKTRGQAQALVAEGHIRLNGRRVERAAQGVAPGDVLVLPLPRGVLIVELLTLPTRRGPPSEAQGCYRTLDERSVNPIAGEQSTPEGTNLP
jgi:ribosome-associated heat shock protein Hsp15